MKVRVRIPATTANLGCGYDCFGMALAYYNFLEISDAKQFSLNVIGNGDKHLLIGKKNMVVSSAMAAFELAGKSMPELAFTCENNIPLSRGMGSSSTAIVSGIFAANQYMGNPLSDQQMLDLAARIEGHPDNVPSALLGGFTVSVNEGGNFYTQRLEVPAKLKAILAIPSFSVSTKKARSIMPKNVPLADAVYNLSHAAYLALALSRGDLGGFGAMLTDRLHQPYRYKLIPGAEDVVDAAIAAGALGCVISGSGPTMLSLTDDEELLQENISAAMQQAFANNNVKADIISVCIDNEGAVLIDR